MQMEASIDVYASEEDKASQMTVSEKFDSSNHVVDCSGHVVKV